MMDPDKHAVQFYQDQESLISALASFLAPAFDRGEGILLILSGENLAAMREYLFRQGHGESVEGGRCLLIEAEQVVDELTAGGFLSRDQFNLLFSAQLESLAQPSGGRIWVAGEAVSELMRRGEPEMALQLEKHWNILIENQDVSLLCTYCSELFFQNDEQMHSFLNVCAEHSSVSLPQTLWSGGHSRH